MFRYVVRVRYGDTDQMGFAYYANYLRWFEIGRAEMMRSLGMSYRAIEESGIQLPVMEAHCRYLEPARYDDEVAIETGVAHQGRARVHFGYRIVRVSDGALLAHGGTEHCCLDRQGKPVRPPAELVALVSQAPRAEDDSRGSSPHSVSKKA